MILTGAQIAREIEGGSITMIPFDKECLTTNSYDLTLGDEYLVYASEILDPSKNNKYEVKKIPNDGLVLKKGEFVLCHSKELLGSDNFVPIIHAKSGIARLGLFVHITADLIDIGSKGNVTFQLYSTLPVRIYSGMKIGQVSFWETKGEIELYKGKYQGSSGPRASESYKDFKIEDDLR